MTFNIADDVAHIITEDGVITCDDSVDQTLLSNISNTMIPFHQRSSIPRQMAVCFRSRSAEIGLHVSTG
jgi:hypothetical protein